MGIVSCLGTGYIASGHGATLIINIFCSDAFGTISCKDASISCTVHVGINTVK
jgi:hypothetical protein